MTKEEAKANQDDLEASGYDLGFWYGVKCEKCCGVYPKFVVGGMWQETCWYECEVCGKKSEPASMPWLAERAWNHQQYQTQQLSLF